MTQRKKPLSEYSDKDILGAAHTWLQHVLNRAAASIFFGPSDTERQLAEHCVEYATEIVRLREVIRKIREAAKEES
jgi:hypothetical protein